MLSPRTKRHALQIIPFSLIWLIFAVVYLFLERGILGDSQYYPSTGNPYSFKGGLMVTLISAMIYGGLVGAFETLYLSKIFVKTTFSKKMIYKTGVYFMIMFFFLTINAVIGNLVELQSNLFDPQVWNNVKAFLSSFAFWSVELYIAVIMVVSLFYMEVSNNLGQSVLLNFFTGKYHKPLEEERIFMFLDMKSSTTFAEQMGHIRYFEMLKEYYADLSDPVVQYAGEIYQYVGDEIIVSWNLKNGLDNNNCIKCFFAMKEVLNKNAEKYHSTFGLLPTFKAGFHFGEITTGEIGVIKKDITFSGDVLNTTARIQGLCNNYDVDLLLSDHLLDKLDLTSEFKSKALGEAELRGRDKKVSLFTILME